MKDQKALLIRCMKNEIPAIVISGNDALAIDVAKFYFKLAKDKGCNPEFLEDFEMVISHFEEHRVLSPETVKLPD